MSELDKHQWALECVKDRAADEGEEKQDISLWTGKQHIKADASKTDFVERDEVRGLLGDLAKRGELVYWHGLVAPAEPDHIDEIIRVEQMAEHPRSVLLDRLEKAKKGKAPDQVKPPEEEVA